MKLLDYLLKTYDSDDLNDTIVKIKNNTMLGTISRIN